MESAPARGREAVKTWVHKRIWKKTRQGGTEWETGHKITFRRRLAGHRRELLSNSECSGKPLNSFKQGTKIFWFSSQDQYCCCVEETWKGTEWNQKGSVEGCGSDPGRANGAWTETLTPRRGRKQPRGIRFRSGWQFQGWINKIILRR